MAKINIRALKRQLAKRQEELEGAAEKLARTVGVKLPNSYIMQAEVIEKATSKIKKMKEEHLFLETCVHFENLKNDILQNKMDYMVDYQKLPWHEYVAHCRKRRVNRNIEVEQSLSEAELFVDPKEQQTEPVIQILEDSFKTLRDDKRKQGLEEKKRGKKLNKYKKTKEQRKQGMKSNNSK